MAFKTFFLDLAARGPLAIIGREAYFFSNKNNSHSDLCLAGAGNLDDILKFDLLIKKNDIYELKRTFIEEKASYGFRDQGDREKELSERKLFSFIVKDLMPYLSGHKEDIELLLGEQAEKSIDKEEEINEQELKNNINKTKKMLVEEQQKYGLKFGEKSAVDYLLEITGGDILVLGEGEVNGRKVYNLARDNKGEFSISINNSGSVRFKLREARNAQEIEQKLFEFVKWSLNSEAINEFADYIEEIEKTKISTNKDLEKIMKLKEFKDGDIGFLVKNDRNYIYQILKPFAMMDPRPTKKGVCYEFPELRVGMRIAHNTRIELNEPVLFEPVWHPFVEYKNTEFQHLCGGRILSRENKSEIEWVAKNLDDAKNLVMHGLTPESIKRHNGDKDSGGQYFGHSLDEKIKDRAISIKKAREKGLVLTNNWKWEDKNE